MATKPKRPRDINQLAKLVVDLSTGDASEEELSIKAISGRIGGLKGGKVRAANLTPAQRSQIAKLAAQARWKKKA